jgi:selenocysteine lyase/cysteine desulfurase
MYPVQALLADDVLRRARAIFPHTAQGRIYMNHAGTSPLSTHVVAAVSGHLQNRSSGIIETYQEDLPMVADLKAKIVELIGAESPGRIALTPNTSEAINIVAAGIPWKSGDSILLNTAEFPANVWPWLNLQRHGVRVDLLPAPDGHITINRILDGITPRTRLVGLSAVQFLSGFRADLATIGEICRSRGVIFAVDAIQAVGAVRINVQKMKIDALSTGGQKWQMSPHGTGYLYLTEELQSIIQQRSLGWLAVADPWDFSNYAQPLATSARRYEGGSLVMPALWGMHAAIHTLLEFTPRAIEGHILALTGILVRGAQEIPGIRCVTPAEPDDHAGIVTLALPQGVDPQELFRQLQERNIHAAVREGKLRLSPHFYCTAGEMETVLGMLREILGTQH